MASSIQISSLSPPSTSHIFSLHWFIQSMFCFIYHIKTRFDRAGRAREEFFSSFHLSLILSKQIWSLQLLVSRLSSTLCWARLAWSTENREVNRAIESCPQRRVKQDYYLEILLLVLFMSPITSIACFFLVKLWLIKNKYWFNPSICLAIIRRFDQKSLGHNRSIVDSE